MNKGLKFISLGIILVLPVLIYLFLRTFGNNQYDLPVFPEEAIEIDGCGVFDTSYKVRELHCLAADEAADTIILKDSDYLIHFPSGDADVRSREGNELRRFLDKTESFSYRLITFAVPQDTAYWRQLAAAESMREWMVLRKCADVGEKFMRCVFLTSLADVKVGAGTSRLILLDEKGRIRGYFVSSDKEDMDRLIIEMDVLNQKQKAAK